MANLAQQLKGKPVYSSGSFAPTRGAVSAQGAKGYLERELSKKAQGPFGGTSKIGNDGKSDTRSGVAAGMISKAKPSLGKAPSATKPVGQGTPNAWKPTTNAPNTPVTGQPVPGNEAPKSIQINPNGVLELPYDPQAAAELLAAKESMNGELLGLQLEQQQQALGYASSKRDAEYDYEDLKRGTLSGSASRGVAFSSGHGVAVGRNANAYNNYMNDLDSENSYKNTNFEMQRMAIENSFQDLLRKQAADRAARAAEDAGNLGFGQDEVDEVDFPEIDTTPGSKPKPKPKGKGKGKGNTLMGQIGGGKAKPAKDNGRKNTPAKTVKGAGPKVIPKVPAKAKARNAKAALDKKVKK